MCTHKILYFAQKFGNPHIVPPALGGRVQRTEGVKSLLPIPCSLFLNKVVQQIAQINTKKRRNVLRLYYF